MQYSIKEIYEYIVALIAEFGKKHKLTDIEAYRYIRNFKAFDYIERHYAALHTYSFQEAIECVENQCRKKGGLL